MNKSFGFKFAGIVFIMAALYSYMSFFNPRTNVMLTGLLIFLFLSLGVVCFYLSTGKGND